MLYVLVLTKIHKQNGKQILLWIYNVVKYLGDWNATDEKLNSKDDKDNENDTVISYLTARIFSTFYNDIPSLEQNMISII